MKIPDFLTHYTKGRPFRSLTERPPEEWPGLLAGLSEENALAFARFGREDYLPNRAALEARMHAEFVSRGGRPERRNPHYLVLGRSPWFERHEPRLLAVRLPLDSIDPLRVSFTWGDSMTSYYLRDGIWPRAEELRREHHGRLFLLDEIVALAAERGLPDGPTRDCPDHYVEAQLWADPVSPGAQTEL